MVLLFSYCHLSSFARSDITQLLDVQLNFWEGFDWDGIWLMGAAGFLFVMWECLEHVTEHECAGVGGTSPVKDVHVLAYSLRTEVAC